MNAHPDFAPLGAGLLARKGEAQPAMSQTTKTVTSIDAFMPSRSASDGDKQRKPANSPPPRSDDQAARDINAAKPMTARVSFHMPMADYLRLKMAGQVLDAPCRDLVLAALDAYLTTAGVPDLSGVTCLKPRPETE